MADPNDENLFGAVVHLITHTPISDADSPNAVFAFNLYTSMRAGIGGERLRRGVETLKPLVAETELYSQVIWNGLGTASKSTKLLSVFTVNSSAAVLVHPTVGLLVIPPTYMLLEHCAVHLLPSLFVEIT